MPGNNLVIKISIMKKIFAFLLLLAIIASCYDEYIKDFEFIGVYFPYQTNVRTLVVGEGMKVELGVALGGVRENNIDRIVEFQIDESFIQDSLLNAEILLAMKSGYSYISDAVQSVEKLKLIPTNYYSLSDNSKFVIKSGNHSGTIILKADSSAFLADSATILPMYYIPLRITKADADTILESKNYAVIGLKYENMLFGNYWHGGVTTVKDEEGNVIDEVKYYTSIPSPDSRAWKLTTVEPFSLVTNGVSELSSLSENAFKITLNGASIKISSMPGATFNVMPDGESTYNQAKRLQDRKIFLNYKYQNGEGNWCYAKDTLTFRNRIRDGVNEWQDENPENYK